LDTGQRYVNTLFHLLRCHIDNNKFDEAKKMIREIRSLKGKKGFNFVNISVRIFANTAYQELTMYNKMGKFNKSVRLLKEVEKKQQKYADNISKEMHVLLTYAKAYSYFGVGNYRESLHYLNQVINDKEQNLRQDIYSFSRIFNVVLHFELRNYEFLEYVVKSTNRYLRRQNRECQIENICAKRIKKLAKTVDYNKRVALLQRMDSEVTELLKNQNECVVLEYFNISAWIKSKLNKVSYKDQIVREHK
jgi:tetratricopeptide (TPR) repeat protein